MVSPKKWPKLFAYFPKTGCASYTHEGYRSADAGCLHGNLPAQAGAGGVFKQSTPIKTNERVPP